VRAECAKDVCFRPKAQGPKPETAAAVITPEGEGGIGVIKVVGKGAFALVQALFRKGRRNVRPDGPTARPELLSEGLGAGVGKLHYGHMVRDGEVLDEVLVAVIEAGEECQSVEVNCHGGIAAVERVMGALHEAGAVRVPGGALPAGDCRLDAIQREAAIEIPRARSRQAVRMLLAQHRGELSRELRKAAQLPAAQAAEILSRLEAAARLGLALCTPKRVVIAGSPNTGKSTLFNALLGRARAIVADVPGTTRDYICDTLVIEGVPFELVDTAGLRETDHAIEIEGIRCAREQVSAADIVVLVMDASRPLDAEERAMLAAMPANGLRVLNKTDLLPEGAARAAADVEISAQTGAGIDELEVRIVQAAVGGLRYSGGPAVFTQRQFSAVRAARAAAGNGDERFRNIIGALGEDQGK